jgi:hypothetical protein
MNGEPKTPFDSIESTDQYMELLQEAVQEALSQVQGDATEAVAGNLPRRKEALDLATYKLNQLSVHVSKSRRLLNDLRTLRRLLLSERAYSNAGK